MMKYICTNMVKYIWQYIHTKMKYMVCQIFYQTKLVNGNDDGIVRFTAPTNSYTRGQ